MNKSSIVVTGGGTGGHLKVAKSFIDELIKRDKDIIFIGSINGQDKDWFESYKNIKKPYFLNTKGVVNKGFFGKIVSLFNIFKATIFCLKIFYKNDIKKVVSVGGFSAAPATFAAILKPNCKLFIHEQNSKMGKLNSLTSKFATNLFSSYISESAIKHYPIGKEFFEYARVRKDIKKIIFLGGSQGAVHINNFALKIATKLNEMNIKIIHQTGKNDFQRVKKEYEKLNIKADVFDFTNNIVEKMSESDFAVSRSGASTLWELTANGLVTFYIPYPYAAQDHQYGNAKFLKDKNLAYLVREKDLTEDYFFQILKRDLSLIPNMSKELITLTSKNAVEEIIEYILNKE